MPDIDASIPLRAQAPNGFTSLKDMLGVAQGAQALATGKISQQRQGVALEQEQGGLEARKALATVMTDPQFRDPQSGLWDLNKLAPAVYAADPKMYHAKDALAGAAQANNDTIAVKSNSLNLADKSRALIGSTVGALAADPQVTPDKVKGALDLLQEQAPDAAPSIAIFRRHIDAVAKANADPRALQGYLMQARSQVMPPSAQIESQTPSGPIVDNGQVVAPMNVKPTAGDVGPIAGTVTAKVLPPTTPVFNEGSQQPGYLGSTGGAGGGGGRGGFVASGPKLGTEANVAGTVDAVNKDWSATNEQARTASQDIGVLQNIKKYAAGAVTGVANDRRAYIAGLAGLLGIEPAQLEKTNTDLLAKNSAMLALAGGDTNLAKLMAESANPNTHMTKEAIEDAANQVIAQRKLALAKQQYMNHFKGDPEQYSKELSAFNQIADPRALQVNDMSDAELQRMKHSMSAAEQRDFGVKLRKLQALGIVK